MQEAMARTRKVQGPTVDACTPLSSEFTQECLKAFKAQRSKLCASRAVVALMDGRFGSGRSMDMVSGGDASPCPGTTYCVRRKAGKRG